MQKTEERPVDTAPAKPIPMNRKGKRGMGFRTKRDRSTLRSIHQILAIGPSAFRRQKTGRTAHFQAWIAEAVVQKHLHTMRTSWLADRLVEKQERHLAKTLQRLDTAGYRNVLKVARATREELLAVKGVGPTGLGQLHDYLSQHQVPLRWEI